MLFQSQSNVAVRLRAKRFLVTEAKRKGRTDKHRAGVEQPGFAILKLKPIDFFNALNLAGFVYDRRFFENVTETLTETSRIAGQSSADRAGKPGGKCHARKAQRHGPFYQIGSADRGFGLDNTGVIINEQAMKSKLKRKAVKAAVIDQEVGAAA
jgi:hypothetical protein